MDNQKAIIVTGSGSGIGRAVALAAARAGMNVVVTDIDEESGERVAAEIREGGVKAVFIRSDVADVNQVKVLFAKASEEYGHIDALVNNAGVPGAFSLIVDMPDETRHRTLSVHLNGTFYCLREAAKRMIAARSGSIVNIASIAGLLGTCGSCEYGVAKAGIINLTKTASKELAPFNVTVNAIAPGMVGTSINRKLEQKGSPFIKSSTDGTPTGRMTEPDDIAALVLFLISSTACNITGQVIAIDGGAAHTIGVDTFMMEFLGKKSPTLQGQKK